MRTRTTQNKFLALVLVLLFLVAACGGGAGQQKQSSGVLTDSPTATYVAALKTGATLYEQGMSLCKDLYEAGKIDKAMRDKVISVAWTYWGSYHAAQKALEYYSKFHDSSSYAKMVMAFETYMTDKDEITKIISVLVSKKGGK